MNQVQKVILSIYLPFTGLILFFDRHFPDEVFVHYVKFTTMVTLLLATLMISTKFREHKILIAAFLFGRIGDFFLVYCDTIPHVAGKTTPFGMAGFIIAYLLLIIAFQKNFKFGWGEAMAAVPVLAIYIPVFIILAPHVKGAMFIGTVIFGFVLCYMAWTSICTLFRGYFSRWAACLIALAGFSIFISDLGVAAALFHPLYAGKFIPWVETLIWATYVPAWTLIFLVMAGDEVSPPSFRGTWSYPV